MSRTLTIQTLIDEGACYTQVELFRAKFGTSVRVTQRLCVSVADVFAWDWAAEHLLSTPAWFEYERVTAPARAEYDRAIVAAWAEYERVKAPARAECVIVAAWAECGRVKAPAYPRATAPALAEYERVTAGAWAEYERVTARTFAKLYNGDKS